jgi:hypothetical protein
LLIDWLVPPAEPEVGELLYRAVQGHAQAGGARQVLSLFPEWSPWFGQFQAWGCLPSPSEIIVMGRTAVPKYDAHWMRDSWWYQWSDWHLI